MSSKVDTTSDMRLEILMDAGSGAQAAGDILVRSLVRSGRHVYVESIIPSEISPPKRTRHSLSGVIVRYADFELNSIGDGTDLILASNEVALETRLNEQEFKPKCRILLDTADRNQNEESFRKVCASASKHNLRITPFEIDPDARKIISAMKGRGKNIYYLGMVGAVCNLSRDIVGEAVAEYFRCKLSEDMVAKNLSFLESGYQAFERQAPFSFVVPQSVKNTSNIILIDGAQALSMGIIDAGIKLCTGYPITPAFNVMEILAQEFPSYGGIVHMAEDEIAAIGAALGGYYGGLPAVTCTSGPGLSLKQEFIGYAAAAEIPVLILNVQRAGPSTGMPTKTEQSDLPAMIFGNHGDNTKIVISVSDSLDCFYAPSLARYLAEKLKLPVMIVADFQIVNSYKDVEKPVIGVMSDMDDIGDAVLERFHIRRLMQDIEMVRSRQSGYRDRQVCRVTGLNTDEFGNVDCSAEANVRAHVIRNEKLHIVSRALKTPDMTGKDEGELLLVGWGSSRGALEEAVEACIREGLAVSSLSLKIVYPLPLMLKEIFSSFRHVAAVEVAYGDEGKPAPLAGLLRMHTGLNIGSLVSEATGRPLRPGNIVAKIKEFLMIGHDHEQIDAQRPVY